jgi:Flp pilus assembly pilin Flp
MMSVTVFSNLKGGYVMNKHRKDFSGIKRELGQAMVEYAVILAALTAALFIGYANRTGRPATGDVEQLRQAIDFKYRGYSYAVSLSEYPETDSWGELADYYDSLGKYPGLSGNLRSGQNAMQAFVNTYASVTTGFADFDPGDLPDSFPPITPDVVLGLMR